VSQLRILEQEPKPLLLINPQWKTKGNLVSDFGFGPWRQRAEDFIQRFPVSYALEQNRIGNPSSVDVGYGKSSGVVWVIQAAPSSWQVSCPTVIRLLQDSDGRYIDEFTPPNRSHRSVVRIGGYAAKLYAMSVQGPVSVWTPSPG
jgi:hypothetical protein